MQSGGYAGELRGLCFLSPPRYLLLFGNLTGSKIKKFVGEVLGGVYCPLAGVMTNGQYTPPSGLGHNRYKLKMINRQICEVQVI